MEPVPEPIRRAAKTALERRRHHDRWLASFDAQPVQPGDVWVTQGTDRPAVVLVVAPPNTSSCQVALCHSFVEMAYDFDLVVAPATPGVLWPLVACGELVVTTGLEHLHRRVGRIPTEHALAVAAAVSSDATSLNGLASGLPLGDRFDHRRRWVEHLLPTVIALRVAFEAEAWR